LNAEDPENIDSVDYSRKYLLEDYVLVYDEVIANLQIDIDEGQEDFEEISEKKRAREEEQKATAAKEAKKGEYDELKADVDEAKAA